MLTGRQMRWPIAWALLGLCSILGCGAVKDPGVCGDGKVASSEECDQGAENGATTSCCSSECTLVAASVTCREAAGVCDVSEACSGVDGACPADLFVDDGTLCSGGNGANACSAADTCVAGVCSNNDRLPPHVHVLRCTRHRLALDDRHHLRAGGDAGAGPAAAVEDAGVGAASHAGRAIADALGHTATIVPQTTLDNIANLANTNILIVSAFEIAIPAARRATLAAFVASGRGLYVQGEFQATFEGNLVFEALLDGLGANFTWGAEVAGTLTVTATGCFGTTPNTVPPITQNFGITGNATGAGFGVIQQAGITGLGFRYCRAGGGLVLTTTDKDNIRSLSMGVPELMRNMLYQLAYASTCTP